MLKTNNNNNNNNINNNNNDNNNNCNNNNDSQGLVTLSNVTGKSIKLILNSFCHQKSIIKTN